MAAGSGAGAALTKIAESAQCVFAANRFYVFKKDLNADNIKQSDLKKALAYCDVDDPKIIDNIFNQLDAKWIVSLCITANKMHARCGRLKSSKRYTFHRGSSWVDNFEMQYKVWNAEADSYFSNINKYTPADIWMVASKMESYNFSDITHFGQANKFLFEKFESCDIIGVSLKKTSVGKVEMFNKPGAKRYQFKFTGTRLRRGDFFDSKDVYLEYDKGTIQFRSFSSKAQGWQGEVKGKEAVAGKVSLGPLNEIIWRTLPGKNKDTVGISDSSVIAEEVNKPRNLTEKFIKEFYTLYKGLETGTPLSKAEMATKLRRQSSSWIYSKYLGMEVLMLFEDPSLLSPGARNKLISEIVLYAMSASPMSAPFVKIS
jgi:hypothetical protein